MGLISLRADTGMFLWALGFVLEGTFLASVNCCAILFHRSDDSHTLDARGTLLSGLPVRYLSMEKNS